MVGLEKPERIRILNETKEGTVVTADLTGCQPEAKFTLEAALGIAASSNYLLAPRNLVVEGERSGAIPAAVSNLFIRSGLEGPPDGVTFQPRLVANQIGSSLMRMKRVDELPPETRAKAERALKVAAALFGKEKQFWSQSA